MTNTKIQSMDPWQEVVNAPSGHIFADWEENGVRVLVRRGGASLCAYVGVPTGHPWWGKKDEEVEVDCHGGLTFFEEGDGKYYPSGWYWFGWDYAHGFDYSTYNDTLPFQHSPLLAAHEHKWTVAEVVAEAREVARQFARAVNHD